MIVEGEPIEKGIAVLRRVLELHDRGDHRIEGLTVSARQEEDEDGLLNITTLIIEARPRPRP